jgi:tyrosinase
MVSGPFEISINSSITGASYVGWSLAACSIRITDQLQADRSVILTNRGTTGGQLVFRTSYGAPEQSTLPLVLPGNGTPVDFFIGGKFGFPSIDDQDGGISVTDAATSNILHERTVMVRIRKNANTLTPAERDRFLYAYATLNASAPDYQGFLNSHDLDADSEIHQRPAFLPWHRAFVLHLERRLQLVDSSVALPYWRFDQPAPNIFSPTFLGGTPNSVGRLSFDPSNPLRNWAVNGTTGVIRAPDFNTTTSSANVIDEIATLALGAVFASFREMEGNPHGFAHISFSTGPINNTATATQDPIFFLLHSNVDRLWAKWQLTNNLWSTPDSATYSDAGSEKVGDALGDTMWPWNGVSGGTRPPTAPGGPLPQLPFPSKPPPQPALRDVIDYIGRTQGNSNHFDYDDVPYV